MKHLVEGINYTLIVFTLLMNSVLITDCLEDAFTALTEMEPLIKLEHRLAELFLEYVKQEEERLNKIEEFLTEAEKNLPNSFDSMTDTEYVGNPVNGYMILKRFDRDWLKVNERFSKKNSILCR